MHPLANQKEQVVDISTRDTVKAQPVASRETADVIEFDAYLHMRLW